MPRYIGQETITFTTKDGQKIPLKNFREIPIYNTSQTINDLPEKVELDEIATREEVFGNEAEFLAYFIFDHNIEKIMESKFDLSNLKEIKIPVTEES